MKKLFSEILPSKQYLLLRTMEAFQLNCQLCLGVRIAAQLGSGFPTEYQPWIARHTTVHGQKEDASSRFRLFEGSVLGQMQVELETAVLSSRKENQSYS